MSENSTQPGFVHLRVHTEYSLADSVVRVKPLMNACAEAHMPAVALTDLCNLFGMVKFYRAAEGAGLKPLVGVDLWVTDGSGDTEDSRMTLLCRNTTGYRNLTRLVTRSYLEGQRHSVPRARQEWLTPESAEGLIALSGGREGDIGQALIAGRDRDARHLVDRWLTVFGDRFYIEVQRTGRDDEEVYIRAAVPLADRLNVGVVATNDVRFLRPDDFESHEARVCIHDGHTLTDPGRPRRYTDQQYLKTPEEMRALFADMPAALENTVEIARRCNLELKLGDSYLPDFPVPDGHTVDSFLRAEAERGLKERLGQIDTAGMIDTAAYAGRLNTELDVITGMGFPGYFLIVADFIRWARDNDIPVGPGRGSGAGSLVAWSLGITNLDPLEHDLLFERFLNPERVSMPDFDIDFCMDGRDRVIDYVARRYGHDRVSQIITYGTMAARAVVRDVGRVLGHPYGFVDRLAKLIPFELGMTLDKALEQDAELKTAYTDEDEVRTLIDLARSLEGLVRNAGKHAGGVVISPSVLTDFAPLYCEDGSTAAVTQFDKDDVEAVGLVKFDFLGLRTLTIIDRAVKTINRERDNEEAVDIDKIPMDDAATFNLLKSCSTTAVFQLESRGMKDLIKRLQPDQFDDIVALVALFRPGPLQSGMVDDFMNRKHGRHDGPIDYLHPDLKSILEPTYGVILYQEQVMQIAQVLAGYSLGEADLLRRAMGKKKPEEMAKQRSVFLEGAEKREVDAGTASYIFDLMEKFAGYGFNKSHSAAYAVLSYQTAWLKAHYPAAFMAAVLSSDMDHTDKVVTLIDECNRMELTVAPPDVNRSHHGFTVSGRKAIRYGLGAVKGVGQGAIESLIAERETGGEFTDLHDLCRRLDLQKANKRVLEALIRAGAMDQIGPNRASLMEGLPEALKLAEQDARACAAGQDDMFGLAPAQEDAAVGVRERPEWPDDLRLAGEKETLGLYLTGHPIARYEHDLKYLTSGKLSDMRGDARRQVTVAGLVMDIRKRGARVSLVLDDRSARMEVTLFDDLFMKYRHLIARDAILVIDGTLKYDDFLGDWRITAQTVADIDEARAERARRLVIDWIDRTTGVEFVDNLKTALRPHLAGKCGVVIQYRGGSARARLALGEDWRVRPTRELMERLSELVGGDHVRLFYPPRIE